MSGDIRVPTRWPRGLLIEEAWGQAVSGQTLETRNPSTGEVIAEIAAAGAEDVDRAVAVAVDAWEDGRWRLLSPSARAGVLWRVGELIEEYGDELAMVETLDNGKPLSKARRIDIPQAAAHFYYHAGTPERLLGETIPAARSHQVAFTTREPVGVVAAIVPWNFPLLIAARNVAPALACGNCVILKPAEETPLSALRLGEILLEAGVPKGVISVLPGLGEQAGHALVAHPLVRKVSFTGSTETGRSIVAASAGNFKRLSLELGGKAPLIVLDDAPLETAIEAAVDGSLTNTGQNCCAATRIFVQRAISERFNEALLEKVADLQVGDGFSPDTDLGPLVSDRQLERVQTLVKSAVEEGAEVTLGGGHPRDTPQGGYFLEPTVLSGLSDEMRISREEVFGPIVAPYVFDSLDEAVHRANATSYGLAAGVFTTNLTSAHRVAKELQAGTVWINCWEQFNAATPWGGVKESGYGRDMGSHVIDEYTALKTTWIDYS